MVKMMSIPSTSTTRLQVAFSTLHGNADNDVFNIRGMNGTVNVRGDDDDDTVNVTDVAPVISTGSRTVATGSIDDINGFLDVEGGSG